MTSEEKLSILEDLLDIEKDSLQADMALDQVNEWDSIALIATIAMFDNTFGKEISPEEVKRFQTVQDILDQME